MEIVAIISIVSAVLALIRTGAATYVEIQGVLKKYEALPATAANIEALRQELLDNAVLADAVDDPRIREMLVADGIDPESLRLA